MPYETQPSTPENIIQQITSDANQCDGCRRGLPIVNGVHRGANLTDSQTCTADRYLGFEEIEARKISE